MTILSIVLACVCIILLSFCGALLLGARTLPETLHRTFLPLAVGVFLGVVFFELLPETFEQAPLLGPLCVLIGFMGFYLLSYIFETYHHHGNTDVTHGKSSRLILIGDAIHNIADGIVLVTAFSIDPAIGIITTIGIALHEIPQEIAEYSILIHSGMSRARALIWNALSASTILIGALIALIASNLTHDYLFVLLGIAAGNLLYIATADLLPELRHAHRGHFGRIFFLTIIGILSIAALITYTHEETHSTHATEEHAE